jgi:8-oxo-dGTP pyrophosphatase MutT (NUDIX family)
VALGKWNGYGGKVDAGETFLSAAVRELHEESGIHLQTEDLTHVGIIYFSFATQKDRDQECHVFVHKNFRGEAQETDEMMPQWRDINAIPYEKMWADDIYWMPRILAGEFVEYRFHFSDEGAILDHEVVR